jgi:hypothetical protein
MNINNVVYKLLGQMRFLLLIEFRIVTLENGNKIIWFS